MCIKALFAVPEGAKVTEKLFCKVLLSSVCSILLCMACLVSATWAWFAVSIENDGNVIQIGTADVKVTVGDGAGPVTSNSLLPQGNCKITIENSNLPDDFDRKATLFITLNFNNEVAGYVVLDGENGYKTTLEGSFGDSVTLAWTTSWFRPEGQNIEELLGKIMPLGENAPGDTTEGVSSSVRKSSPEATTAPSTDPSAAAITADSTEETTVPL